MMPKQDKPYRVTYTPAKGSEAGRKIIRTYWARSEDLARESCQRIAPGATISNVELDTRGSVAATEIS